jgi:hypothetical protein
MTRRKRGYSSVLRGEQRIASNHEGANLLLDKERESRVEVALTRGFGNVKL